MRKYFSFATSEQTADIVIYGDITSWEWYESDVSSYTLSKQLKELGDVSQINVHINSYGGEVAEGLAIYNALKNHKAKVTTVCDGFACSAASVIFMAGDERLMNKASLLMIHNAWNYAAGNSAELRKAADDLDIITSASIEAYMSKVNIPREEVESLMTAESWLSADDAVGKGFATGTVEDSAKQPAQNALRRLHDIVMASQTQDPATPADPDPPEEKPEPEEEPDRDTWSGFFNALLT